MDNSEKLTTQVEEDEGKQNKTKAKPKQHNVRWTPLSSNNANNVNKT